MATAYGDNPYPGLRPFEEGDFDNFFGRDDDVEELVTRVFTTRFLAVVGASGSGKSSAIRAGLIPALRQEKTSTGAPLWLVAKLRPEGDPFQSLALSLGDKDVFAKEVPPDPTRKVLAELLTEGPRSLINFVQPLLGDEHRLLLVVDQFEEIFRYRNAVSHQASSIDTAGNFIDLLTESTAQTPVPIYVLITMRAEYLGNCSCYPQLAQRISDGLFLFSDLGRKQLLAAIVEPAKHNRVIISDALANQLLNDIVGTTDLLPSLQHCLMQIWSHNVANQMDNPGTSQALTLVRGVHYREGSVRLSIGSHAQKIFESFAQARHSALVQRVFKAITTINSQNETVRNPASVEQIIRGTDYTLEEVVAVTEPFRTRECSMLLPPEHIALQPTSILDITHESLIRQWKTLLDWAKEEAERNRPLHWIREDTRLWLEKNRDDGFLPSGQRLVEMGRWLAVNRAGEGPVLSEDEKEFMARSLGHTTEDDLEVYEALSKRAEKWDRSSKPKDLLLTGASLKEALGWDQRDQSRGLDSRQRLRFTGLQREYINASEKAHERARVPLILGAVVGVSILTMAGLWGVMQYTQRLSFRADSLAAASEMAAGDMRQEEFLKVPYRIWLARVAHSLSQTTLTDRARQDALEQLTLGPHTLISSVPLTLDSSGTHDNTDLWFTADGRRLTNQLTGTNLRRWNADSGSQLTAGLQPADDAFSSKAVVQNRNINVVPFSSDCPDMGYRVQPSQFLAPVGCLPDYPNDLLVSRDRRFIAVALNRGVYLIDTQKSADDTRQFQPLGTRDGLVKWGFLQLGRGKDAETTDAFYCITRRGAIYFGFLPEVWSGIAESVPALGGNTLDATLLREGNEIIVRTVGRDLVVRSWRLNNFQEVLSAFAPLQSGKTNAAPRVLVSYGKDQKWSVDTLYNEDAMSIDGNSKLAKLSTGTRRYYADRQHDCPIDAPADRTDEAFIPLSSGGGVLEYDPRANRILFYPGLCGSPQSTLLEDSVNGLKAIVETQLGAGFVSVEGDGSDQQIRRWRRTANSFQSGPPVKAAHLLRASFNIDPTGRYLVTVSDKGDLEYVDLTVSGTNELSWKSVGPLVNSTTARTDAEPPPTLIFSSSGDRLGVLDRGEAYLVRISSNGSLSAPEPLSPSSDQQIDKLFFDRAGTLFATINSDGSLTVFSSRDSKPVPVRSFTAIGSSSACKKEPDLSSCHPSPLSGAFSLDNSMLAVAQSNGTLRVFNLGVSKAHIDDQIASLRADSVPITEANKACILGQAEECFRQFQEAWKTVGVVSGTKERQHSISSPALAQRAQ